MTTAVLRLPVYPSIHTRKALSASQLAILNQTVAASLSVVLGLPPSKRDTTSTRDFLISFAQDTAFQKLQNIIWLANGSAVAEEWPRSSDERLIHRRSLLLAEKLAPELDDLQLFLDLAIIYGRTHASQLRRVFAAATKIVPGIESDLLPSFTAMLSQDIPAAQGLYARRKVAECIFTFLRGAKGSPELLRPFARNKQFIVALATLYDLGMTSIATSYGGTSALVAGMSCRDADEWETLWMQTKVALLDSFHIILSVMLGDLASCPQGPRLAAESERTFDVIFALLEAPSSSAIGTPVPFLNQTLLADYQHAYSLTKLLSNALKHAQEKDVRLDLLENTLQSLDDSSQTPAAGALKILLRSSGVQPGIDNLGTRNTQSSAPPPPPVHYLSNDKGKSRAAPPSIDLDDPDLEVLATQVLDILPDTPVRYVKMLLAYRRYGRNPEQVVEALLEGTAPPENELEAELFPDYEKEPAQTYDVSQRQNVFDEEDIDLSRLRIGKKEAGDEVLRDRTFIEEMKADILRRAEAITDDEEEEVDEYLKSKGKAADRSKASVDLGLDDDEDSIIPLRVAGDGEDSDDEGDEDGDDEEPQPQTPEMIIEQAFLADPAVFERDAVTRRSKARAELRAQTGWDDGQIEGWKIMLDRTPGRKEKLGEKYEFRGNEKGLDVRPGGRGRGRGRGGGGGGAGRGGRGGGRGGAGGAGGSGGGGGASAGGEASARERAWKDKNKASRGNHNRKRGHDKKMVRAGATIGPST